MTEKSKIEPKAGLPMGPALLNDPLLNKGTAFTTAERLALRIDGLLPTRIFTLEEQEARVLENYRRKSTDLERYIHLMGLQDRNETLFQKVVQDNLEEMMPIVYTPTVAEACQLFGHIFRRARGMTVNYEHKGNIGRIIQNWVHQDVRVIVMTDGERILGIGDQGASGMGIPVGKLALYTACAGIPPATCLPVLLDVGTENEEYLKDPLYMGLRQHRVRGKDYEDFVGEFITAARARWPRVLIQFEDFGNTTAFRLLEQWRSRIPTFNDDMQGTAAVVLAGLFSSLRITKQKFVEQKVLFLGAGEAGIGIGNLIVSAMVDEGANPEEARKRCWFVDSKGLVVKSRGKLAEHKLPYAHDAKPAADFLGAVQQVRPTTIIGVSTSAKAFNKEVVEAMCKFNERPIVMALSNPTSKSECTAEEAYTFSKGRAIFASGSPFPPFTLEGKTYVSGQGNNSYIFPGVGLGIVVSGARLVTDRMFAVAARSLAELTTQADLDMGRIYPSLKRIREISAHLAAAVAESAFKEGLASIVRPANLLDYVKSKMWDPKYESYVG